jgi:hypothetical protein
VTIQRPPTEVFAFLSDWSNNPRWQKGMQSCTWTSEPPLRVGSTYDQVATFMGRTIVSSFEVAELEPVAKVRIRTTASSLPLDITRLVAPAGDGATTVTAIVRGHPGGVMRLFNPLMRLLVQRSVRADYDRLKELLDPDA